MHLALMLERIDDRDVRLDLDGLAVENSWVVAPLAHGIGCGLQEQRVSLDDLQRLDAAVGRDDSAQFDLAFAAGLYRERRISGLDAMDQHGRFQMCHKEAAWRFMTDFRRAFRLGPGISDGDTTDARGGWSWPVRKSWGFRRGGIRTFVDTIR